MPLSTTRRPSRPSARLRAAAALVVAFLGTAATAAANPDAIVAVRTGGGGIHLDGHLDEAAWQEAPAFTRFVESFPRAGVPGDPPTEVRVVYDDETLFIAVRCTDPDPAAIARQLARRDTDTSGSDRVEIAIDTGTNGSRTAADFIVNAAGVLRDQLLFADVNSTDSWDAVWDAAVSIGNPGWTAEIAIPFKQLRFSDAREQRWRIVVRRFIPRTHQVLDSTPIPRNANPVNTGGVVVSRLGPLEGLVDLPRRNGFELLPYVAARATARPQYSDPSRPTPRLVDPALDVGLDFRTPLAKGLTLTGALNPDFGQVESDQVIQNLSNSEPFFPEKRPFFLEGLDIFQPVGAEYGSPQQLFYSRRIGLSAPILGAAKVTGAARDTLDVGVLDSLVMGAANASLAPVAFSDPGPGDLAPYEANPDRRWRFRWRQPFHLGPENGLPAEPPVTTNYFAAVARQRALGRATAGATFTAATPLEPRCRRDDFADPADYDAGLCASRGANALGLDLDVPGEWGGFAQVAVSQQVGGPEDGRVLRDGTVLRPGDLGFGGHFRAGKLGGEPWRASVVYVYEDRKLDLNAIGFQPLSDYQWADLILKYVRPNGFASLHSFSADYLLDVNWTADGRLPRGLNMNSTVKAQLHGYQTVGLQGGLEILQYDTREIARSGVPFERMNDFFVALILGSDPSRRLQASGDVFLVRLLPSGRFDGRYGVGADLTAIWRPHARLETRLDGSYGLKPQGPRWIETLPDGTAVFGDEDPEFLSLTLRQQLVFTPRLSAQLYAQLFTQAIRWGNTFYGAPLAGRRSLSHRDLEPIAYAGDPAAHDAVVNVNAVLRWEYRLGSTIYFVYTRSQSELPVEQGSVPAGLTTSRMFDGPVTESLLVKWSYWFER